MPKLLDTVSVLIYLAVLYLLTLPLGYLVLSVSFGPRLSQLSPAFILIFSIPIGMITMTLILSIIGVLIINGLAMLAVSITSLAMIGVRRSYKFFPKKVGIQDVAMLGVFALTLTYMALILGYWGWPNQGDVALHSGFVSLLISNGKFQLYLNPIAPQFPFNFPPGFHMLAADYSLLVRALPAESVFLLGGAITILIQVLVFLAAYIATKSFGLSILAYSSTFAIHPSPNLERWLLGYFYNGPYPFLFAVCGISCFFILLILRKTEHGSETWAQPSLPFFIMTLWMAVTYSPYATFFLAFLAIDFARKLRKNSTDLPLRFVTRPGLSYGAIAGSLVLYLQFTLGLRSVLGWAVTLWTWVVPFPLQVYAITPTVMFDSVLGWSALLAGIASIYLVAFVRDFRAPAAFYLVIFIPTIVFLIPGVGGILYFLLPLRTIVVTHAVSWLVIVIFLGHVIDRIPWDSAPARSEGEANERT